MQTVLVLLTLLQVKHLFADYFLQTTRMLSNRDIYVHSGRAQHAGLHALFSVVCLALIGAPIVFLVILSLIEGVVHYHIDWVKGHFSEKSGDTPADPGYWRAFGVDQFLPQVTYVAMIWAWVRFAF
jgi:hypothetical protein